MRISKKIITIATLIFIVFNTILNLKIVKAENISSEYDLYSKENLYCFKYKGYLYRSEFVVYEYDGIEYPAYCLNRELDGVSLEQGGYKITIENLIENQLVWKAIINGYPYKTYEELGCNNEMEAFTATKLAAYDMMYNYNLDDFKPVNEAGNRVVAAIKNISNVARNSTQTKLSPELKALADSEEWKIDENEYGYVSKTYSIKSNTQFSNYVVNLENGLEGKIKLTDLDNNEKNVFKNNEKFKILVPIKELKNDMELSIFINANLETYPIYYGKAPDNNLQNYAISGLKYESKTIEILEKVSKNETSLEIIKIDGDTQQVLSNCEFFVMSETGNEKYKNLITDENGKIELHNLIPDTYLIQEIKSLENYENNNEVIKIKVEMNEMGGIVVKNYKKQVKENTEEEKIVIEDLQEEAETEEIKLPKTGY